MSLPRLNGIIRALESGQHAFSSFQPIDINVAVELTQSNYDGIVLEGEHQGWDITTMRHALQYMLNRSHIAKNGIAPKVTPMARVPSTVTLSGPPERITALGLRLAKAFSADWKGAISQ